MIKLILPFLFVTSAYSYIDYRTSPLDASILTRAIDAKKIQSLDQFPALLPEEFRLNFVLKHGLKRVGERGHLIETLKDSQSSDPDLPRVMMWDERSGFSISYNGGGVNQAGGQRLDLLSFDNAKKTFKLEEINFPLSSPGKAKLEASNCLTCHGPDARPIFAMYPDWPRFYGSDNDELLSNSAVQKAELSDYIAFTRQAGSSHPRYTPLFDSRIVKKHLGLEIYPTFPYRYELKVNQDDASRAFAWRPGLRVGILYNRMMAQNAVERIKTHKNFPKMGKFFLYNLLQCGSVEADKTKASGRITRAQSELQTLGVAAPRLKNSALMDYSSALNVFGLKIKDIDIRYSYNHEGYNSVDASKNPMAVGYIGNYFNSYFDGSATIDELIAAQLYSYYLARHPGLAGKMNPQGLTSKYGRFKDRMKYDANFFKEMDKRSLWIPIPYPSALGPIHHRVTFLDAYTQEHKNLCSSLGEMMWWPTKP